MIQLHYNWFLFSIIFWTTNHYLNNFKKNNIIFNLINNLITILFIGVSISYNHQYKFLIFSLNEENILDIFSVFSVYLNIGFILLDLIINKNIIYNSSMLILLSGYIYGGYFSYLVYVYFGFQFLEIIDNVIFLFKLKNKYILMFNLFFRFGLLFFILFNWMIVNIESDKSTKELIPYYIFIPFYWNFIGSISIFMIIFYNISIMFLSLDNLGFV
jgi:hypothetical protein